MRILRVKPKEKPEVVDIAPGLESFQHEVGGYIEAVYPFEDRVALVVNEEGKITGLPLNRALYDESGEVYDVIAGTFLVVGLGEGTFDSLSDEMIDKYQKVFACPELIVFRNNRIMVVPF